MSPPIPTVPSSPATTPSASRLRKMKKAPSRSSTQSNYSIPKAQDLIEAMASTPDVGPTYPSTERLFSNDPGARTDGDSVSSGYFGSRSRNKGDISPTRQPSKRRFELPSLLSAGDIGMGSLRHSPSIKAFIGEAAVMELEKEEEEEVLEETQEVDDSPPPLPPSPKLAIKSSTLNEAAHTVSGPILVEYKNSPYKLASSGMLLVPRHLGLEVASGGFTVGQTLVAQGSYKSLIPGEFNVFPGETFCILGVYSDGWGLGYRRLEKRQGKLSGEKFYEWEDALRGDDDRVDINLLALLKDLSVQPDDYPCVKVHEKHDNSTTLHLAFEVGFFPLAVFRNSATKGQPFKVTPSPTHSNPYNRPAPDLRRIRDDVIASPRVQSLDLRICRSVVRGEAYNGYVPGEVARCMHMLCSAGRLKGEWWEEQVLKGINRGRKTMGNLGDIKENYRFDMLSKEGGLEGERMDWVIVRYASDCSVTDILQNFQRLKKSFVLPLGTELPDQIKSDGTSLKHSLSRSKSKLVNKIGSIKRTISVRHKRSLLKAAVNGNAERSTIARRHDRKTTAISGTEDDILARTSAYLSNFPSRQNVLLHGEHTLRSVVSPVASRTNTVLNMEEHQTSHARRPAIPDDLFQPLTPEWNTIGSASVTARSVNGDSRAVTEVLEYLKDLETRMAERFEGLERAIVTKAYLRTGNAVEESPKGKSSTIHEMRNIIRDIKHNLQIDTPALGLGNDTFAEEYSEMVDNGGEGVEVRCGTLETFNVGVEEAEERFGGRFL